MASDGGSFVRWEADRSPLLSPKSLGAPSARTKALPQARNLIRAVDAAQAFAVSGAGLTIAIIDSGINTGHVDFPPQKIVAKRNFTRQGGADAVEDTVGHGSYMAGIAAGANVSRRGVAPGAGLVVGKVVGDQGFEPGAVESALDWLLDRHEELSVGALCMSFGDGKNYAADSNPPEGRLAAQLRELTAAGVACVIAAGNFYHNLNRERPVTAKGKQGMGFPAILPETLSVAAVADAEYARFETRQGEILAEPLKADRLLPISQRLGSVAGGKRGTDVVAPGGNIASTGWHRSDDVVIDRWGTSYAVPIVAGVVLLLQEYWKRETGSMPAVEQLRGWLRDGGHPVKDVVQTGELLPATGETFARADALGALGKAREARQAF
jgi:subtilisin family serine protease